MRNFTNLSERSHFVTAPDLGILTGSLTTPGGFSDGLHMAPGIGSVATSGTWTGSITVQMSQDNSTWFDIQSFTGNFARTLTIGFKSYVRVGFKAAAWTGGTAKYILGQGY